MRRTSVRARDPTRLRAGTWGRAARLDVRLVGQGPIRRHPGFPQVAGQCGPPPCSCFRAPMIGPRHRNPSRDTLRPHEAALVLGCTECEVDRLIELGALVDVSRDRFRRIGVDQIRGLIREGIERGEMGPLAEFLLDEVTAGRLAVPRNHPDPTALVMARLRPGAFPEDPGVRRIGFPE